MSVLERTRKAGSNGKGVWEGAQVAVPAAMAATAVAGYVGTRRMEKAARERGRERNERLKDITFPVSTAPTHTATQECTEEELRWLRLPLELALQPLDSFEGFTKIDQFRESALRYQLNSIGYVLSILQATRTPAFTGYVAEAQRNSIEKMLDKRIWRYWTLENLWGNFRWDPDPIARDNVMLSGYFAHHIGLFERTNHDYRYSEPGALTFRWSDKKAFEWDYGSIAENEHRKMTDSPLCLYPCEPNWSFPFCNSMSLNGQILHDRIHGTTYTEETIPKFRQAYDQEFLRPDGRTVVIRSRRLGIALPFSVLSISDAIVAYWMYPGLPDIAQRLWWFITNELIEIRDGKAEIVTKGWDALDPGNYTMNNPGFLWATLVMAGRELGDDETADAVMATLEDRFAVEDHDRVPRYEKLSTYANLYTVLGRLTRHNSMRDLIQFGMSEARRTGPVLAQAAYPDVLVARADTDGRALDLVLRPGAGATRTTLGLERLAPSQSYTVDGAVEDSVTADDQGRALIEVELDGRVEVHVRPDS